jgi:hypothetical protein
MDVYEVNWDERPESQPIEYEGETCEVCEGCEVVLQRGGIDIMAKVVKCRVGEPNIAEVTRLMGSGIEGLGELKVGATVYFWDRHVFSCAA